MSAKDAPVRGPRQLRLPWVMLVLLQLPYWTLILGAKVWLFAKHLPNLGPLQFADGMIPQLLALIPVGIIGYVGVVATRRHLVAGSVAQLFLLVLLALMQIPLLFGLDQAGSAVTWNLAAWWIEWNGTAQDGSWYMMQRVIAALVTIVLVLSLGLLGPSRAKVMRVSAAGLLFLCMAMLGPVGTAVPKYLGQDPLLYAVASNIGLDAKWARMRARPVPAGMHITGPPTQPHNIAVIILESVGWNATSLNPEAPPTTPFLAELASRSLVADRAHVVVPSTYKAHIAALCGVEPYFTGDREMFDKPFDFPCLPGLLREHGYATAYFTSSGRTMLGWDVMVKLLGYDTFIGFEDMATEGFEWSNMWAYEDDIMVEPSREWLSQQSEPFLTTYMVCAPHYEYRAPARYGREDWVSDDTHNRYLNAVRYVDHFIDNLMATYEELGLADDTIFVIVGDHGEAFGEHVPRQHNAVPYDEVLRVPLVIHQPGRFPQGHIATGLRSQLDIAPTLAQLIGMPLTPHSSQGQSLLAPPDRDRSFASCLYTHTCAAVHTANRKLVHHFGDRPDELFDWVTDPREQRALNEPETTDKLRRALLDWYANGL